MLSIKTVFPDKNDTIIIFQVHGSPCSAPSAGPVITLEVPSEQYRCLSPITELPSPMPTPMPSPLPTPSKQRHLQLRNNSTESSNQENTADDTESEASVTVERSSSDTSGADGKAFFQTLASKIQGDVLAPLAVPKLILNLSSPLSSPSTSPISSPKVKHKPPPLVLLNSAKDPINYEYHPLVPIIKIENEKGEVLERFDSTPRQRSQSVDATSSQILLPAITVSPAIESVPVPNQHQFPSPPLLTVTSASPQLRRKLIKSDLEKENLTSYTTARTDAVHGELTSKHKFPSFSTSNEKPGSLDLPHIATNVPIILNTDSDPDSPLIRRPSVTSTSKFLSPFFGAVGLHATSESNLSSSGYSSAYSPGPSRCNSNNPLFCGETDEPMTPPVSSIPSKSHALKKLNYLQSTPTTCHPLSCPSSTVPVTLPSVKVNFILGRTDSETTDEPQTSQQDSALEVDTNDEPELEDIMEPHCSKEINTNKSEPDVHKQRIILTSSHSFPKETPKLQRLPPTIVVHTSLQNESMLEDYLAEKPMKLSPASSRSESPISDSKLSVHKIYPAFFSSAGKLEIPYTDSDGLYDYPSSEVINSEKAPQKRRHGNRKLKRASVKIKVGHFALSESHTSVMKPTETLEPPQQRSPRRVSPKRRLRSQNSVDLLSSSNESIESQRSVVVMISIFIFILSSVYLRAVVGDSDNWI